MAKNIIEIKNIVKKFGSFTALDGIDMSVKEGEVFGLLGPNGAGKTTLINLILGLLQQTSGTITVNGLDNRTHLNEIKNSIGMMTQERVVELELTARQNLTMFAELYHMDKSKIPKRVEESLNDADLTKFADVKAGTFSGGMQRRLQLVTTMVHKPHILILDEPTTGLDVQNRNQLWERIKDLNKSGTTVILTTQYLEEADVLCERIAIIDHGKVKATGTSSELKALVSEGNILEIIAKNGDIDNILKILKKAGVSNPVVKGEKINAILEKDSSKTFTKIANAIDDNKIKVLSISAHLPTLDDVFIKLTGSQLRDTTGSDDAAKARIQAWRGGGR